MDRDIEERYGKFWIVPHDDLCLFGYDGYSRFGFWWWENRAWLILIFIIFIIFTANLDFGVVINTYCGVREFVIPAHFTLGPKPSAEERRCRGHATKVQMA